MYNNHGMMSSLVKDRMNNRLMDAQAHRLVKTTTVEPTGQPAFFNKIRTLTASITTFLTHLATQPMPTVVSKPVSSQLQFDASCK